MGYPIFGKIKNIVLPLPINDFDDMTIEEYKEFSGIDLREVLELDQVNKRIVFKQTNALYFFNCANYNSFNKITLLPVMIIESEMCHFTLWNDTDGTPAKLEISLQDFDGEGFVIQFVISDKEEFDINNIKINMNAI